MRRQPACNIPASVRKQLQPRGQQNGKEMRSRFAAHRAFSVATHPQGSASTSGRCHAGAFTAALSNPFVVHATVILNCYRNILDASLLQATNAPLPMSQSTPTLAQLQRGLQISEQIAALETELAALFSGSPAPKAAAAPAAKAPAGRKKGGMSAAGRARIVAAQKARWAKIKAGKAPAPKAAAPKAPAAKATGKKKRVVSPEVKAKLAAAMKARWAAAKAGKGPAPTSKKK